ncbi:Enoyl-CoA hydratase / Delta(3)-cis-delta(2)-trans-enoyl-CoA isomerase / 3-hydroxyacyl-CoA dehydrogenase / 3-hydroxybutyryl-CoA epimerase [hydrothermal vent metagenome]|uniref:enoyl-CoA hydratase n=1 Tax=hydrothermal vent metagenome TaxID=652676 RepID=A0A3B1BUV7_9ZZZZ
MTHNKFKHWRIEKDDDNIIWLHFDRADSSTNILASDVLEEFNLCIDDIRSENPIGLVIISAKENGFIAGANIKEFAEMASSDQAYSVVKNVQSIFDKLEALSFPTVAAINGYCLGGGMELALACKRRIAVDDQKTRLALPEVLLGIHPGFGGTMRATRLLGGIDGLDMMLTGRRMSARAAKKLGLIDMAVPRRALENAARMLIKKPLIDKKPVNWKKVVEKILGRQIVANLITRKVKKKVSASHYPAPFALIDLWRNHSGDDKRMLDEEAKSISNLITEATAQNLIRAFFLQEKLKSIGKKSGTSFKHIHVIGAGIMGGDIAAWSALRGIKVTLQDREAKYLAPAIKRAHALFKKRLKDKRAVQAAMDRLIPDVKGEGIAKADLVVEAVFEDVTVKQNLLKEIEPKLKSDAFIATNTSSIPLEEIAGVMTNPARLVGVHFFNPVAKMMLVEVVRGRSTSDETFSHAVSYVHQIGKLPLPVKSEPGFLVNRILMPYLMEGVVMLGENIPAKKIDDAATRFGMPMGPILLADTVGLDICLHVANIFAERIGSDVPDNLKKLVEAGNLGKKSGKGFYEYKNGKPVIPETTVSSIGDGEIEDRLIMRFLNESVACLRDEIVEDNDLLDAGMIFGAGFAPFRGGPMKYIADTGAEKIVEKLKKLEEKYGDRFKADEWWGKL